jgi:hypothetical protein
MALAAAVPLAAVPGAVAGASTVPAPRAATIHATCEQVSDALADGPDPDVDPVGYALAQVRPLREIHTSDVSLRRDIDGLASAYETFYRDNGGKDAKKLVTAAGKKVDKICPGAV